MRIAFIGFGEAARAFTDSLMATGHALSFSAFDLKQDATMTEAMRARGVAQAATPEAALLDADWIIAAVTADQSLVAAQSVLAGLAQGQLYVDINSVSPDRKQQAAALIEARGARYLDMAVMAPVHPRGHATPVLVAGACAEAVRPELESLGFSFDVVGPAPGDATAIKMVRSLFVKGLEAITVECALAAAASGVYDRVMPSLERSYPQLDWAADVPYRFERTLRHGARRAAEMREVGETIDALGLTGGLAREIAEVQARMGALAATDLSGDVPLPEVVAEIARLRGARVRES
ncbi:DUF1932 domain-containing protein [Salipiger pacificus]|nr:DUF1932 domain-containing protein [Alloyangia pacifica]MCA0947094.1 DUF1932 domain-containing protein [Alloyangia pacifica]